MTASSPPRTAARSPRRGDHNVPVCASRGRTQIVSASVGGTVPIQRVSDTITCVAPMPALRAKAIGTGSRGRHRSGASVRDRAEPESPGTGEGSTRSRAPPRRG